MKYKIIESKSRSLLNAKNYKLQKPYFTFVDFGIFPGHVFFALGASFLFDWNELG